MKHAELISQLDETRILAAIASAEAKTTGHLRVMVSKRSYPDPNAGARKHFKVLKLDRFPERNAVLIFVAPRTRTFAIYGDAAIHAQCGEAFWNNLRDEMTADLKEKRFTDGIVRAIDRAGEALARFFPKVSAQPSVPAS